MSTRHHHDDAAKPAAVEVGETRWPGTACPELALLLDRLTAERHRPVPPPPGPASRAHRAYRQYRPQPETPGSDDVTDVRGTENNA